jgi:probable HAF family extracellular repeat protein
MFHCTRPRHAPLWALLVCAFSSTSQAQSAYTLTTLKSPTSTGMEVTDMDNTGKVVGHTYDQVLATEAGLFPPTFLGFKYWPRIRATSWSATRSSTITGVKRASKYGPIRTNEAGVTTGMTTTDRSVFSQQGYLQPAREKNGAVTSMENGTVLLEGQIKIGGINLPGVTVATARINTAKFTPLAGMAFTPSIFRDAVLITPGQTTPLDRQGHYSAAANDINDLGQVVGSVLATNGAVRAATWMNGQISRLGEDFTEAVAINNAGQVLVARSNQSHSDGSYGSMPSPSAPSQGGAAIWLGSQTTRIGTEQQVIKPTAMNNAGTVVGCADGASFIWKNGVMLDLAKEVTGKGVKLPVGAVIDCPLAINDAGSILTLMRYPVASSGPYPTYDLVRIRLNASP